MYNKRDFLTIASKNEVPYLKLIDSIRNQDVTDIQKFKNSIGLFLNSTCVSITEDTNNMIKDIFHNQNISKKERMNATAILLDELNQSGKTSHLNQNSLNLLIRNIYNAYVDGQTQKEFYDENKTSLNSLIKKCIQIIEQHDVDKNPIQMSMIDKIKTSIDKSGIFKSEINDVNKFLQQKGHEYNHSFSQKKEIVLDDIKKSPTKNINQYDEKMEKFIKIDPMIISSIPKEQQTHKMKLLSIFGNPNAISQIELPNITKTDKLEDIYENFSLVIAALKSDKDNKVQTLSTHSIDKILENATQLSYRIANSAKSNDFLSCMTKRIEGENIPYEQRMMHYFKASIVAINEISKTNYLTNQQFNLVNQLNTFEEEVVAKLSSLSIIKQYEKEGKNRFVTEYQNNQLTSFIDINKGNESGVKNSEKKNITTEYLCENPETINSPSISQYARETFVIKEPSLMKYVSTENQSIEMQTEHIKNGGSLSDIRLDLSVRIENKETINKISEILKIKSTALTDEEKPFISASTHFITNMVNLAVKENKPKELTKRINNDYSKETPITAIETIKNEVDRIKKETYAENENNNHSFMDKVKGQFTKIMDFINKNKYLKKGLNENKINASEERYTHDAIEINQLKLKELNLPINKTNEPDDSPKIGL